MANPKSTAQVEALLSILVSASLSHGSTAATQLPSLVLPPHEHPAAVTSAATLDASVDSLIALLPASSSAVLWGVKLSKAASATERARQRALVLAFLRARDGDATAAQLMLENTLRFRQTTIAFPLAARGLGCLPTDLLLADPNAVSLPARPTIVIDTGKLPAEAFADSELLVRWWVLMQEALMEHVFASDPPIYTLVLDARDLKSHHFGRSARQCATALAATMADYYPDTIGSALVINSPVWFDICWACVKPFLPREFVRAVRLSDIEDVGRVIELAPGSRSPRRRATSQFDRWIERSRRSLATGFSWSWDGAPPLAWPSLPGNPPQLPPLSELRQRALEPLRSVRPWRGRGRLGRGWKEKTLIPA